MEANVHLKGCLELLDHKVARKHLWTSIASDLYAIVYWEAALFIMGTLLERCATKLYDMITGRISAEVTATTLQYLIDDIRRLPMQLRQHRLEMLDELREAQDRLVPAVIQLIQYWKTSDKLVDPLAQRDPVVMKPRRRSICPIS